MNPKTARMGIIFSISFYVLLFLFLVHHCHAAPAPRALFELETSNSMYPVIHIGDKLLMAYVPLSACKPGDIITFRSVYCVLPVTHRIVRQVPGFPNCYITKGDNNTREDNGYVSIRNYIARVAIIIHAK